MYFLSRLWFLKTNYLSFFLWFQFYFIDLCFVDHESFCLVTYEGGTLISVANLTVVVNTNICSWVTHSGRGLDENFEINWPNIFLMYWR